MKSKINVHLQRMYGVVVLIFTIGFLYSMNGTPSEKSREIIQAMISAHGGMEKWRSAPTASFEDELSEPGAPKAMMSKVTVEQSRRRAYIDFPDSKGRIAWDGKRAWSEKWKAPIPPRFVALLNYYFLNLPWLSMDKGVNLSEPGKARLWNDSTEFITVKMTFDAGVGDTSDDYYLLFIDPKTHRLKACEYIATYSAMQPPNAKASPPHILVYETFETVDGLVVPTGYSIFDKNHKLVASCKVRNWSFKKPFDLTRMTMPSGAVIDTSKP